MFWNKKDHPGLPKSPSLQDLAGRLGVERRANARVCYPQRTTASMPAISFKGNAMRVHDLSVGGCCLVDTYETLGPNVGNELVLSIQFAGATEEVRSRLVGSINDRRHIQFLNLSPVRQEELKAQMAFGLRALGIKAGLKVVEQGPSLAARELWSSMNGDAVIVEDGDHRVAQAEINGELFYFYRNAWPVDRNLHVVVRPTLHNLILFLANIGYSSPALKSLQAQLEELALEEQV